jgi:hypothetical protein
MNETSFAQTRCYSSNVFRFSFLIYMYICKSRIYGQCDEWYCESCDVLNDLDRTPDFSDSSLDPTSGGRPRSFGVVQILDGGAYGDSDVLPDVGMPPEFARGTVSGWDVRSLYFQYDDLSDTLLIGLDCFGICGDADGDGDAGRTSAILASIGGVDLPNLADTESFTTAIDLNLDVADVLPSYDVEAIVPFDFIIGVPAGQPAPPAVLACSIDKVNTDDLFNFENCFGIYNYQLTAEVSLARRYESLLMTSNGTAWPVYNYNPNDVFDWPTPTQPNLEWTIGDVSTLRASKGVGFVQSNREPWEMLVQVYAGSSLDAGIGDDYVPSQFDYAQVLFSVPLFDQCDVNLGNNDTCSDCKGIPNGPNVYDECDVCGGDSTACRDCANELNGAHIYDVCDVCGGDGTSCIDCNDELFGTCRYDECGVCCGDDTSCICVSINSCVIDEVDYALLRWTVATAMNRIAFAVDVLDGVKQQLGSYDVERGNVAQQIDEHLAASSSFRELLHQFIYVQVMALTATIHTSLHCRGAVVV